MHIYIEISDVVYALKEIPQGAKDTKDWNLTIFSCCVNLFPPVLVRHLTQILPTIWPDYWASCPTDCLLHLDSPLPITLWPLDFPLLTPSFCMPRSFFIGKKREMFEHPVFCLASQVMDLTIREYLHHLFPFPPHSFKRTFTSSPPFCLFSFSRNVAPAMLVFICAFVCESEWGVHQSRDLSSTTQNQ